MKEKILQELEKSKWDVNFIVYGIDVSGALKGYTIEDDFDILEVITKSEYDQYLITKSSYNLTIDCVMHNSKILGYALILNGTKFFRENHYGLIDTIEEAIEALKDCKKKILEK